MRARRATVAVGAVAAMAVSWLGAACGLGGTSDGQSGEPSCAPEAQRPLLSQRVEGETPTEAFTLDRGTTGYVMVTLRAPTDNGLSGGLGGAATLRVTAGDAAPKVHIDASGNRRSDDPKVNVGDVRRWQRLELPVGTYRFYSLAGAPTIAVIACPG